MVVVNQLRTGKLEPRIASKFARLGFCGIQPWSWKTSAPAFSDVEIIQTIGRTKNRARMIRTM